MNCSILNDYRNYIGKSGTSIKAYINSQYLIEIYWITLVTLQQSKTSQLFEENTCFLFLTPIYMLRKRRDHYTRFFFTLFLLIPSMTELFEGCCQPQKKFIDKETESYAPTKNTRIPELDAVPNRVCTTPISPETIYNVLLVVSTAKEINFISFAKFVPLGHSLILLPVLAGQQWEAMNFSIPLNFNSSGIYPVTNTNRFKRKRPSTLMLATHKRNLYFKIQMFQKKSPQRKLHNDGNDL